MMRVTEYESSIRVGDQSADGAEDLVGGSVIHTYRRIISPTTSISKSRNCFLPLRSIKTHSCVH